MLTSRSSRRRRKRRAFNIRAYCTGVRPLGLHWVTSKGVIGGLNGTTGACFSESMTVGQYPNMSNISRVLLSYNSSKPKRVDGKVLTQSIAPLHRDKPSHVVPHLPCIMGSFTRKELLLHVYPVCLMPPPGTSNEILSNAILVHFSPKVMGTRCTSCCEG